MTNQPLPVESPLSGFAWTWIAPFVVFAVAAVATWLLYRHFAGRGGDS